MNAGIKYSPAFANLNAAIAAGATLDELLKWEEGDYPGWFKARIIVWHKMTMLIEAVVNMAAAKKAKRKGR